MKEFNEVKEVKKATQDVGNKTKSFENSNKDVNEARHIKTINEDLAGKKYPGTDVKYAKHEFRQNGEKVEGVYPEFKSKYDTRLPKEMYKASDTEQFSHCTEKLKQKIEKDPEFAKQFNARQIEQIRNGAPRISGYSWHHHENPGKMQLVDAKVHETCRHTGGRSSWGGGSGCR